MLGEKEDFFSFGDLKKFIKSIENNVVCSI